VSPACLTISLTCADGPVFQPARQRLSVFVSGLLLRNELRFAGGVAERGGSMREFSATREQFETLGRAAADAGLMERVPRVEPVVDTSDHVTWVLLHVAHEKGTQTLTLDLLSSGYQGPDAPVLRRWFAVLLSLAAVEDDAVLHTLTGR